MPRIPGCRKNANASVRKRKNAWQESWNNVSARQMSANSRKNWRNKSAMQNGVSNSRHDKSRSDGNRNGKRP